MCQRREIHSNMWSDSENSCSSWCSALWTQWALHKESSSQCTEEGGRRRGGGGVSGKTTPLISHKSSLFLFSCLSHSLKNIFMSLETKMCEWESSKGNKPLIYNYWYAHLCLTIRFIKVKYRVFFFSYVVYKSSMLSVEVLVCVFLHECFLVYFLLLAPCVCSLTSTLLSVFVLFWQRRKSEKTRQEGKNTPGQGRRMIHMKVGHIFAVASLI